MKTMKMSIIAILAAACLLMFSAVSFASPPDWNQGTTDQRIRTLSDLQPGLGTVMIEYGNRFTSAYYAAKGGNWGMAAYQLKEAGEIQEVGEATRPAHAPALKSFEHSYLDNLNATVKAKDFKQFKAAFNQTIEGCNGCHAASGHAYIKYQLPKRSPSPTSVK